MLAVLSNKQTNKQQKAPHKNIQLHGLALHKSSHTHLLPLHIWVVYIVRKFGFGLVGGCFVFFKKVTHETGSY